jgi:DNA-directed RNA polymerase
MNEEEKKILKRSMHDLKKKIDALNAQVDSVEAAGDVAKSYYGNDAYIPNFLDSRGRVYYRSAYLQPQSSDAIKGLIRINDAKPLTQRGYLWLIWHIATVYGFDKADFNGRIEWTLEQLQNGELEKVITDPNNSQLIKDADQPSLFIQAVSVFFKAKDSGDPTNYVCNIEIGMDATSSGIQFLSAIALDAEGGKKVNLITNPDLKAKADIYKAGVDKAMVNILSYNNILSKWLTLYPITRTMAKRPIMTLPYSASENSAAEYVEDELDGYPLPTDQKERDDMRLALNQVLGFKETAGITVNPLTGELEVTDFNLKKKLARFIARELRTACAIEIPAAMKLLEFFKGLPKLLQKDIDWYTPDGLYVVNKYRSMQKIRTCLNEKTEYGLTLEFDEISDSTNYIDAGNGLSPNFIHSLDANLVREVARRCDFKVIFIHDQFLCHPADADAMFQIIKESFVDIIKSDPLGKLLEQHGLSAMEPDLKVNTLDLNKVLESEFIVC